MLISFRSLLCFLVIVVGFIAKGHSDSGENLIKDICENGGIQILDSSASVKNILDTPDLTILYAYSSLEQECPASHCVFLANELVKAASKLKKMGINIFAVDLGTHSKLGKMIMPVSPGSVKFYSGFPRKNPYGGPSIRDATLIYEADSPGILRKAVELIPDLTLRVESEKEELKKSISDAFENGMNAVLVLFTKSTTVKSLTKAIGYAVQQKAKLIQVSTQSSESLLNSYGVDALPSMVLFLNKIADGEFDRVAFKGDLKDLNSVVSLVTEHTSKDVESHGDEETHEDREESTSTAHLGSTLMFLENSEFSDIVVNGKSLLWIIGLLPDSDSSVDIDNLDTFFPNWLAATKPLSAGHIRAGVILCSGREKFELCQEIKKVDGKTVPTIMIYSPKFTEGGSVLSLFSSTDIKKAIIEAQESLPQLVTSMNLKNVSPQLAQQHVSNFISHLLLENPDFLETHMILIAATKEASSKPSILLQSLAVEFQSSVKVLHMIEPSNDIIAMFGISKVPGLALLFNPELQTNAIQEEGPGLASVAYDPRTMGPIHFDFISNWIQRIESNRASLRPDGGKSTSTSEAPFEYLDEVEFTEITYRNWEKDVCAPTQSQLCVLILVSSETADSADDMAVLRYMLQQAIPLRQDGSNPWEILLVKADCQFEFVTDMGFEGDVFTKSVLPSILVYAPKRSRVCQLTDKFETDNIRSLLKSVLQSKIQTKPLHQVPVPKERNCDAFMSNMLLSVNSEEEIDDLMAEILLEEEARKKEIEDEIKKEIEIAEMASKIKKKGKKKKKKRTEVNAEL